MRHGKRFNHLGRKPAHRKATLSNMATSLILHKRITTTVAKAKALKKYVEPLITRSKDDTTHSRRMVFKYLQNKESVKELFGDVADKVAGRPGGYTRIVRTGNRLGDNADMCMMELVDFNELMLEETEGKAKTRRGRRKKKSGAAETAAPVAEVATAEEVVAEEEQPAVEETEAVVEEAVVEETVEVADEAPVEAVAEEEVPVVEEEAPAAEEPVAEVEAETPAAEATPEEPEADADEGDTESPDEKK